MQQGQVEMLQALFVSEGFAAKTLKILGERVFRVEIGGLRHYRRANGRVYKSLTTFLGQIMPERRFLTNWRVRMAAEFSSAEAVDDYVEKTADYGSALHVAAADFAREGGVVWSDFEHRAFSMLSDAGLSADVLGYALPEFMRDFASLLQFFYDYNVEILAVEVPVWCKEGSATLIDFVVEMDAKLYDKTPEDKRKRHKAIINIKSGKKGFFEEHALQLVGERLMFNQVFSKALGYEITEVYNLAPSNWRERPTYKIKQQTREIEKANLDEQFRLFLRLGKLRGVLTTPERTFTIFTGQTKVGENPQDALQVLTYDQFSKLKIKEHDAHKKTN